MSSALPVQFGFIYRNRYFNCLFFLATECAVKPRIVTVHGGCNKHGI